jgi:glycosyltransferase involved in cell wall biosynthesis
MALAGWKLGPRVCIGYHDADTAPMTTSDLPRVSIITPSYNQASFLEETICSVLEQDYANLEYIIVDGGSKDGSVEIIRRYESQLAWWVSEPDQGQTDALNKGFGMASGDILAWLNSDDTYLPGAISGAVEYLMSHPEAGLVYGDANLVDENGTVISRFPCPANGLRALDARLGTYPSAGCVFPEQLVAAGWPSRPQLLLCDGL